MKIAFPFIATQSQLDYKNVESKESQVGRISFVLPKWSRYFFLGIFTSACTLNPGSSFGHQRIKSFISTPQFPFRTNVRLRYSIRYQ